MQGPQAAGVCSEKLALLGACAALLSLPKLHLQFEKFG